jgi:hypothetical protein
MVTQQVDLNPPGGAWQSPAWLTRLDVIFAGLSFNAVGNFLAGQAVPSAWRALAVSTRSHRLQRIDLRSPARPQAPASAADRPDQWRADA